MWVSLCYAGTKKKYAITSRLDARQAHPPLSFTLIQLVYNNRIEGLKAIAQQQMETH